MNLSRHRALPALLLVTALLSGCTAPPNEIGWGVYGRDEGGTRYSPAAVVDRQNVGSLQVAWTYRTGEAGAAFATDEPTSFETTPLVRDGIMYIGTPLGRVIALHASSGAELWVFDPAIRRDIRYGDFASRGVSLWEDSLAAPGQACGERVFIAKSSVLTGRARRANRAALHGLRHRRPRGSVGRAPHSTLRAGRILRDLPAGHLG